MRLSGLPPLPNTTYGQQRHDGDAVVAMNSKGLRDELGGGGAWSGDDDEYGE